MNKLVSVAAASCVATVLSIISVHYFEEVLMPVVEATRLAVYGEQNYSPALAGCDALDPGETWIHPTTLALTVYGDVQVALEEAFGRNGPEVLPKYAGIRRGDAELQCVARYLLAAGQRQVIGGRDVMAFRFDFPEKAYGLKSGWVSGLTQGVVGQVFLAAYLRSGDEEFLRAASETGQLLTVEVRNGGVKVEMSNESAWFEEYAQHGIEPPLVLNGHLLALDYLYWMMQLEGNMVWKTMFESGLRAAVEQIEHYQGIGWSYYDQENNLVTRKYQSFHVRQLDRYSLHDETGTLGRARDKMKWQLYVPLGVFQRLITQPSRLLLFLTTLFFVVYFPIIWFVFRDRLWSAGKGIRDNVN